MRKDISLHRYLKFWPILPGGTHKNLYYKDFERNFTANFVIHLLKKDDKVGKKKLDIEEKGKKERKRTRKKDQKKIRQKNAYAHAPKIIADFSHCHATSSWRKRGPKKKGWQRNWGFVATNIPYFEAKILIQLN